MALLKIALLTLLVPVFFVVRQKAKLKDDCVIEEVLEEGIKQETGIDIDLTPESPEVK